MPPNKLMRVLLVDDDEMVIMVLERLLARDPMFKTVSAARGKEALNILRHFPFDALICDMALPDLSGEDLLGILRKEGLCPKFVMMMSGIVRPMASHTSQDFVFIEKPFSPEKVISVLHQAWIRQQKKRKGSGKEA